MLLVRTTVLTLRVSEDLMDTKFHFRLDENVKMRAQKAAEARGKTLSEACRDFAGHSGYAGQPGIAAGGQGRQDQPEDRRPGRPLRTARFLLILYYAIWLHSVKDIPPCKIHI